MEEREESVLRRAAKAAFVVGAVSFVGSGALGAELVQGADPVVFSPETGKAIAEILIVIGASGIGLAVFTEVLDKVITSVRRSK